MNRKVLNTATSFTNAHNNKAILKRCNPSKGKWGKEYPHPYLVGQEGSSVGGVDNVVLEQAGHHSGELEEVCHSGVEGAEEADKGGIGGGHERVAGAVEGVVKAGFLEQITQDGVVEGISNLANGELVAWLSAQDGCLAGSHGNEACEVGIGYG